MLEKLFRTFYRNCRNYTSAGAPDFICRQLNRQIFEPCGKVVVITGGGTGIGFATAAEFLLNGVVKVIIAQKDKKQGLHAVEILNGTFGMNKAVFMECDVNDPKAYQDVLINTKDAYCRLDVLFNNAGVLDDKNIEKSIQVNVNGVIRGNLLAQKFMQHGCVINCAGTMGLSPWPNCPVYTATKHAVVAITKCFGDPFHAMRTGNRTIAICPGFTKTNLWEEGIQKHGNDVWAQDTVKCLKSGMQMSEMVGKGVVHMAKYAKSGEIYVVEDGVLYKYVMPPMDEVVKPEKLRGVRD